MMRNNWFRNWGLIGVVVSGTGLRATSADPHESVVPRTSIRTLLDVRPESVIASSSSSVYAIELSQPLDASDIRRLSTSGGVAGAPVGSTQVYKNEINPVQFRYSPGVNHRVADDLRLANGACNVVYYNLAVYGAGPIGASFNVHTELWTGDPCLAGKCVGGANDLNACTSDANCPGGICSRAIAGTAADFTATPTCPIPPCPPNLTERAFELEATLAAPTAVPATVWMLATFSRNDASWIIAEQAEVGSTQNLFSEFDPDPNPDVCSQFIFTGNPPPWAGFWANVHCETLVPPEGACCNGTACMLTTQAACQAPGVWQGDNTTCQPNACLTGACCTGADFEVCADTNEPGCPDGLFRPGTVCSNDPCGENFEVYRNDFATRVFVPIDPGEKWGDDLSMGAGAPCQLVAYEVLMAGDSPPATFNAHVELWYNNDRGTPMVDADDTPRFKPDGITPDVIPGTQRDFNGLAADLTRQRLLAGPFNALQLPKKVWMVVTTNSDNAGPIFGGNADVGFSQDGFRIFNHSSAPNAWSTDVFNFGSGFDPTYCPSDSTICPPNCCVPHGSFRAIVWCEGAPPTGACCNDVNGTCADNVLSTECEGRWKEGVACDSENPFDPLPPCGAHACCYPNSVNPNAILCEDLTPQECAGLEYPGSSAPGLFCVNIPVCPRPACINRNGSCFTEHGATGCDNAFCCEKVCDDDPSCCTGEWTSFCAERAQVLCSSDHCADAMPISGVGTYSFDSTTATTDGPIHQACVNEGGDEQIEKDVWYCWTASCTGTVFVRTCGQTTVDTKLAVYDGCTCPPADAALFDCSDDRCGLQSTAVFHAVAGRNYLIRLGNYPGSPPGTGSVTISCGPPNQPTCPASGDCCAGDATPGCLNEACCESVCGCDFYCCETEWDDACATTGLGGSGCGADVLCPALCGSCPAGTVTFNDPPPGVLDAGRPYPPDDATQLLGIDTIQVTAPPGADLIGCWRVCETATTAAANGIADITDNGGGLFTIRLARPITPGAVTKITYAGSGAFARYIFHPANLNTLGTAAATDVDTLVKALNGTALLPAGLLSGDINRSGTVTAADVLDAVGLLNGEGAYAAWLNTTLPIPNANCP